MCLFIKAFRYLGAEAGAFVSLLLIGFWLTASFAVKAEDVRELVEEAVRYTVDAKIQSRNFSATDFDAIDSMILLKDGRKHRFSHLESPGVWSNTIYSEASFPGEYNWLSDERDAVPSHHVVVHRSYYRKYKLLPMIEALAAPGMLDSASFAVGEGRYRKIPCYRITISYPTDEDTIAAASAGRLAPDIAYRLYREDPSFFQRPLTAAEYSRHQKDIQESYFAKVQILVDKTPGRPFIYALDALNGKGKKIYSMNWGDVEFPASIPAVEFEPPPGTKIVRADNHDQYAEQYVKYFGQTFHKNTPKPPSWLARFFGGMGNALSRNFDAIILWSGRLFFLLGIVIIASVVLVKIRSKKRLKGKR